MRKAKDPGKVARLPRSARETINQLLVEDLPASAILEKISDQAKEISGDDIARWKDTGHQDWLNERERLAELGRLRELAKQVTGSSDGATIQEVGLQIAAGHIYEMLCWFNPRTFKKKVQGNLADYARVVTMLVRLSDGGLKYERYRTEVAERKAKMQKELSKVTQGGGVTPEFLEFMEKELKLL
jgi:hypothetical protein